MPLDKDSQASPLSVLLGAQSREGTGIVFVSTSDHRQVRIALDAGRIVYVGFGFRRGRIAAQFAASATAVSATFSPGQVELVDNDLPPERALLAELAPMLAGGARGGFGEPPADQPPPVPATGPTTVQRAPAPASGVTTAQRPPPAPPSGVT